MGVSLCPCVAHQCGTTLVRAQRSHQDECVWTNKTDWRRAVSRNEANSLRQRVEELEDLLQRSRGNTALAVDGASGASDGASFTGRSMMDGTPDGPHFAGRSMVDGAPDGAHFGGREMMDGAPDGDLFGGRGMPDGVPDGDLFSGRDMVDGEPPDGAHFTGRGTVVGAPDKGRFVGRGTVDGAPPFRQPYPGPPQPSQLVGPLSPPTSFSQQRRPGLGPPPSTPFRPSTGLGAGAFPTEREGIQAGPSSLAWPGSNVPKGLEGVQFQNTASVSPQQTSLGTGTPSVSRVYQTQSPTDPPEDIEDMLVGREP